MKMKRKILVSDLDGTLIQRNEITSIDRDAINKFVADGNIFVLATGRNYYDFMRAHRFFNIPYNYLVLNGGSLILNENNKIYYSKSIDEMLIVEHVIEVLKIINAVSTLIYISHEKTTINMAFPWKLSFYINNINSICLDFRDDNLENVEKVYSLLAKNKNIDVIKNGMYIDVLPSNISKKIAINELLFKFGLSQENLATIGDDWNDISMLMMTQNSYAIISDKIEVLNSARNQVSNISECIEHFMKVRL
jgi:HAD-superfamily hydrolase, subfamily IIB